MSDQSYARHAHHPVEAYFAGGFTLVALITFVGAWLFGWNTRDLGLISLALAVALLVSISRRYIVRLQDQDHPAGDESARRRAAHARTGSRLTQLDKRQIIALRFASDAELPVLVDRAARENLSADQIKREIKSWRPDRFRT